MRALAHRVVADSNLGRCRAQTQTQYNAATASRRDKSVARWRNPETWVFVRVGILPLNSRPRGWESAIALRVSVCRPLKSSNQDGELQGHAIPRLAGYRFRDDTGRIDYRIGLCYHHEMTDERGGAWPTMSACGE